MKIYVLPDNLSAASDELNSLSEQVEAVDSNLRRIYGSLDWQVKSKASISNYIKRLSSDFDKAGTTLKKHGSFLEEARNLYAEAENQRAEDELRFSETVQSSSGGGSFAGISGDSGRLEGMPEKSWFEKFFFGDLKGEGSLLSGELHGESDFFGHDTAGTLTGELFYGEYSAKNKMSFKLKDEKGNWDLKSFGLVSTLKATGALAKGEAKGNIGRLSGAMEGSLLTGAVSGEVKATIFDDGEFNPSIKAGAKGSVSAAKGSAEVSYGDKNYDVHGSVDGDLLHAEAEAEAGIGYLGKDKDGNSQYGVSAKAGAMASAAEGKVKGGFTLFGIKVNAGVKGYAGAVGVEAGGSITTNGVKASFAGAAAIGGGVDIEVDWSGFGDWAKDTVNNIVDFFRW